MHVVVVGPKITPPWDSAIASFSWSIIKVLLKLVRSSYINFSSSISLLTLRRYFKLYEPSPFISQAIKDDLEIFLKEVVRARNRVKAQYFPSEYKSNKSKVNKDHVYILIQPRDKQLLSFMFRSIISQYNVFTLEINGNLFTDVIKKALPSRIKVLRTSSLPLEDDFISPGIDTSLFKPDISIRNKNTEHIKEIIDELKTHNDYIFSFMGPIFGQRMMLGDMLKALNKLKKLGIQTGLIGFITIRHVEDMNYVHALMNKLRSSKIWRKSVWIEARPISTYEKVALCNHIDLFLYPLIKPVEISDPPLSVLEHAACKKPSVTLNYGNLGKLYPARECMYKFYSIGNVVNSVKRCLEVGKKELNLLRELVDKYYSLTVLEQKMKSLLSNTIGD